MDAAFDAGAIIRTHVLRPTWHFVAPEDLRWLLALTGPRLRRAAAHRHRSLEIDDDIVARSLGIFERALSRSGSLTRRELGAALAADGIEASGGRLAHLVMVAEYEALVCSGPRRGVEHTYMLVDERVPAARVRDREQAFAEVASRYVLGHGPVQDIDLAWWSGLNLGEARRGLAGAAPQVRPERIGDRTFWMGDPPPPPARSPGTIRLLPNYDELLVALRDRRDALDPALPAWARAAEEIFSHVITRGGLVVGRWLRGTGSGPVRLTMEPRVDLDATDRAAIMREAERYASFVGRTLSIAGLD